MQVNFPMFVGYLGLLHPYKGTIQKPRKERIDSSNKKKVSFKLLLFCQTDLVEGFAFCFWINMDHALHCVATFF